MASLVAAARRLEGKVAVITGGASGIGESTARLFARQGAKVLIADVQDELGQSLCNDINSKDGSSSSLFVHCDVTKEEDVENLIDTAISKYGKLDIMYNNAGISGVAKPDIVDNTKAEFEKVVGVNLVGAFLGTKHAARVMKPVRSGSVIMTASVAAVVGGAGPHAYACSKHGVVGLMKNTAVELGQFGIRVNCVSPYFVPTPMVKSLAGDMLGDDGNYHIYNNLKGPVLMPEDIAEAALYLGSDEAKYVSGQNIVVDGGFTIVNTGFCMFN